MGGVGGFGIARGLDLVPLPAGVENWWEGKQRWEACRLSCVARRGSCWSASGPCSWGGQLLSLCEGHTKHCGCLAAEWNCWPHLPSPTHSAPDFPGAGTESWQAVISRKRIGSRDTWRRKASGRRGGPFPSSAGKAGREGGAGAVCMAQGVCSETPRSTAAGVAPRSPFSRQKASLGQGCSGVLASVGWARTWSTEEH